MAKDPHFVRLEAMYLAAPINDIYRPTIDIGAGTAQIQIEVDERYFHAAGFVHGSVYFKMLDDAAFFAANSLETERFVLTSSFTTYLTRPMARGVMRAVGKVVNESKSQFIAESAVCDGDSREIGRANGVFVRSKMELSSVPAYAK